MSSTSNELRLSLINQQIAICKDRIYIINELSNNNNRQYLDDKVVLISQIHVLLDEKQKILNKQIEFYKSPLLQ
jgi:hypothetical protein